MKMGRYWVLWFLKITTWWACRDKVEPVSMLYRWGSCTSMTTWLPRARDCLNGWTTARLLLLVICLQGLDLVPGPDAASRIQRDQGWCCWAPSSRPRTGQERVSITSAWSNQLQDQTCHVLKTGTPITNNEAIACPWYDHRSCLILGNAFLR